MKRLTYTFGTALLFLTTILGISANSGVVPMLELQQLIADSEIVVTGKIGVVNRSGESFDDETQRTGFFLDTEVQVDQVLKGDNVPKKLPLRLFLPVPPIGYGSLSPGTFRLLFLKHNGKSYRFANPYFPSVVAAPGTLLDEGSALDNAIMAVSRVLASAESHPNDKIEAVYVLSGIQSELARDSLRVALESKDTDVHLEASAGLLRQNDLAGLGFAELLLESANPNVPRYRLLNLAYSIRGVTQDKAIPALARLVKCPVIEARRASAEALGKTGSWSALPALESALGDSDFETRYNAAIAMADITGEGEWRPLVEEFKQDERRYIRHWKEWHSKP